MEIKQLKKELGLGNKDLAEFYDMSYGAYANSSAKERYERALCLFYSKIIKGIEEHNEEQLSCFVNWFNTFDKTQSILNERVEEFKLMSDKCIKYRSKNIIKNEYKTALEILKDKIGLDCIWKEMNNITNANIEDVLVAMETYRKQ